MLVAPTHLLPDDATLGIIHIVHLVKDDPLDVTHHIRTLRHTRCRLMQPSCRSEAAAGVSLGQAAVVAPARGT